MKQGTTTQDYVDSLVKIGRYYLKGNHPFQDTPCTDWEEAAEAIAAFHKCQVWNADGLVFDYEENTPMKKHITPTCSANPDGIHGTLKTMTIPGAEGYRYGCKDICTECGEIVWLRYYN